jgi:NADPH-dependent curcumin reductase CurA
VPEIGPGEFLVRTIYWSVDPAQRGWASAEANYSQPVGLGEPMRALGVGVVLRSNDPNFSEGEFLYGWFGWQDYAVVGAAQILLRARHRVPLSAFAGLLGINGLTAFLALTELGRPKEGETLLVSTAAGAVGSFVGQIGRILGCRTVALTGDDEKVTRCRERYGYEAAYNYKVADLRGAFAEAAPQGIDVYFDNTGGVILDTALRHMAGQGRVIQCGTAANTVWNPPPQGPRNEREVLTRRLIWSGFVIFDHVARFGEAAAQLTTWYRAGQIVYDEDIAEGVEHAPGAIATLYAGENRGKKLIYVG